MSLSILIAIALFIGVFTYYLWIWSFWMRKGIKGPRGLPFFGIINAFQSYEKPWILRLGDWTKVSCYFITNMATTKHGYFYFQKILKK